MVKLIILLIILSGSVSVYLLNFRLPFSTPGVDYVQTPGSLPLPVLQPSPTPTPTISPSPTSYVIPVKLHVFQSFNNCGPAALSMALSYYGVQETQTKLGQDLRPYQIPGGDNDDKSVTLEELAEKSKEYGLIPYHRPNGNTEILKNFIANDMPVITRTWLKPNEDIGHYRLVRGFDETTKSLIQDDSLQGKNLSYSYSDFNELWKKFNFEYLVLVPKDKQQLAENILNDEVDEKVSWKKAVENAEAQLAAHLPGDNTNSSSHLEGEPTDEDIYARFNLSVALYNIEDYQGSIEEFEKVENKLSFRTLWYQIEPILAYQKLKNYTRVFEITDKVLNYHNRAFSELYMIRGEIYLEQGDKEKAKAEFDKAVFYNSNFTPKIPQI